MELDLKEILSIVKNELYRLRYPIVLCFAIITLAIVFVGSRWPIMYKSSGIIYADEQNIIQPLLKGTAEVTRLDEKKNHAQVVSSRLFSPSMLKQLAAEIKAEDPESNINEDILKYKITIEPASQTQVKISSKSEDRNEAFVVTSAAMNVFVKDSSKTKREESQQAFSFIDSQVKTYKAQLQVAEENLKRFKGQNTDGTEQSVNLRSSQLQTAIEQIKQNLLEARTRRDQLKLQLTKESKLQNRKLRSDTYRERLTAALTKLDTLRLSYQENHPDIVELKYQIAELERSITEAESSVSDQNVLTVTSDPVYDQLRSRLTDAELEVRTLQLRLESNKKLLKETFKRAKRIAEFQAELAELTRDYDVTKGIYEDMLERKEKARLSMTLDLEGQGISYKILEPPVFPNKPVGLRFIHFYLAAPFVGAILPIGLLIAFLKVDPRIRFSFELNKELPEDVEVLASIPRMVSTVEARERRQSFTRLLLLLVCVGTAYVSLAFLRLQGII